MGSKVKLLYFSTLCGMDAYEAAIAKSRTKPSTAPLVFESSLMDGLSQHCADIEILSFPMIPAAPDSKVWFWGKKRELLPCGYSVTWIPTINLAGVKQVSRRVCSYVMLKKWLKRNRNSRCAVMVYSVPPFLAPNIVRLCNQYRVKCIAIIADLPSNMFMNHKFGAIKHFLAKKYLAPALRYQGRFDGYIYLTQPMKQVIAPNAPYQIIEGIGDIGQFDGITAEKSQKRVVMYAGRLHKRYGVENLIKAYLSVPHSDMELWLFGAGSFEEEIKQYVRKDATIRFWGQVSRREILCYEQQATLLVNCRSCEDEYVKYSFPSKTIEYMLSGTPVLTTKLPGIPAEYEKYLYTIETNSIDSIASAIQSICAKSDDELREFGKQAQEFVVQEKNAKAQAEKILKLIDVVTGKDD